MAHSERSKVNREDSKRGLRLLVQRSRRALRLFNHALTWEGPTPEDSDLGNDEQRNPQLIEAVALAHALHSRFAILEERFALLSDKVESLGLRLNEAPRRIEGEGTLRPPKVPRGLDVAEPEPNPNEYTAGGFAPPAESRQQSGFGVRPLNQDPRAARSGSLGPLLSGNVTGLSLSSLFSLFEFDKSSGSLSLQHGNRRLDVLLRGGRVVRCELDGVRTAASTSVREAFAWPQSTFLFRRDPDQEDVEPPQSVNALMLEAMRFHDEGLRTG